MKKFIKLMSLSLAAALVFGMSVSAAGSSETGTNPPEIIIPDGMTKDQYEEWHNYYYYLNSNEYLDWSQNHSDDMSAWQYNSWKRYDSDLTVDEYKAFLEEVKVEMIDTEDVRWSQVRNTAMKDTIEENVNLNETKNAIKVAFNDPRYAEVVKVLNLDVAAGKKSGNVTIKMPEALAHETYYVVHFDNYTDMNIVEVIPATAKDGSISFTITSGSPYAIVKMDPTRTTFNPTGETEAPSESTTQVPATTTTTPGTSPKTGETVPVAGILAVILMAGAIVCANRVRYNK